MKKYLVPSRRLEAYDVVNNAGQDLGQVQEFMIDMTNGRVAYAVVAYGGTLGFTDKWIAMPFEALCWTPERKKFTVDLKPEVMMQAPGIDKKMWPDHYMESDTGWLDDLYEHYSCKPYWGNDTGEMMVAPEMAMAKTDPMMLAKTEMPAAKMEPMMSDKTEMPAPKKEARRAGKFEIFMDKSGEFRFRLVASNGEPILASEGYKSRAGAMDGIKSVMMNAETASVEDLTEIKM
ncbi:DUF1508 domain-containing protein [Dehalogenimonas etheniformans]|uniref:DUF1508 domain-containing protein n=1 Tax=Dehalogenimonas etheniformans TaxID=1536648 RepID=A0A2P5P593_9CHLR|nr:DUF1508 domain-containing protein [Dehalogenimonas etheniformans]PPD57468.1 DUF1508 domain-containing protein [Dehalogenimonas etheniformans]QNT76831.1 DUF1508 domain-containing protein [Dehalogenimonas etheniformans]